MLFLSAGLAYLPPGNSISCEVVFDRAPRGGSFERTRRGVLQSHLTLVRHVINSTCLEPSAFQPRFVPHLTNTRSRLRARCAALHRTAERAITERVVQLADKAPSGRRCTLKLFTKQPCSVSYAPVELFRIIPAILDRPSRTASYSAYPFAPRPPFDGLGAGVCESRSLPTSPSCRRNSPPSLFRRGGLIPGVSKSAQDPPFW